MTSSNFSWGILGFILTILASITAIVVLAILGYTDPILFSTLALLATNALIALSTTMNPNRKFQDEVGEIKAATQHMTNQAVEAQRAVADVKKLLQ